MDELTRWEWLIPMLLFLESKVTNLNLVKTERRRDRINTRKEQDPLKTETYSINESRPSRKIKNESRMSQQQDQVQQVEWDWVTEETVPN